MLEFQKVPQDLHEQLRSFRATHPYKSLDVAGVCWKYIACGQGQETLLLLPGAPGLGEMAFQQIVQLEHTYRILSISYPSAATTVAQILAGLQGILAAENIQQTHVDGSSYGGIIAQCLIRHIPQQVEKLILSHTGVPSAKKARIYTIYVKLLSLLPQACIHALLKWAKHLFLSEVTAQRAFWNAYFDEVIVTLSKEDYLTRMRVLLDFYHNYTHARDERPQQTGKVLIVEAGNDEIFTEEERQAFKTLYPQAQIHTFPQATHALRIASIDEYLNVATRFLNNKADVEEVCQNA